MIRNIRTILQQGLYENPPEGALKRCLASLPDVQPRHQILLPLIKLQLCSLPRYTYGALAAVFLVSAVLSGFVEADDFILYSGSLLAGTGLLLIIHLLTAQSYGMTETERCCRYSFSRIILARCMCLAGLLAALCAAVYLAAYILSRIPVCNLTGMLLPLTVSCAVSLGIQLILQTGNVSAAAAAYLSACVFTLRLVSSLPAENLLAPVLLLAVSAAAVILETGVFIARSNDYEAYNI